MAWGTWVHQVLLYTLVFVQGKARVRGLHSSRSTSEIDLVYRYKCVPGTWAKTNKTITGITITGSTNTTYGGTVSSSLCPQ